jgi:hypothetical protein
LDYGSAATSSMKIAKFFEKRAAAKNAYCAALPKIAKNI